MPGQTAKVSGQTAEDPGRTTGEQGQTTGAPGTASASTGSGSHSRAANATVLRQQRERLVAGVESKSDTLKNGKYKEVTAMLDQYCR